jgi:hypothetical protein
MSRLRLSPTRRTVLVPAAAALITAAGWAATTSAAASAGASTMTTTSFLSSLGPPKQVASTVPANGDVNPYGVAMVAASAGKLVKGDILVSNFNDKANVQGTGKTIVEVSPSGSRTTFAQLSALPHSLSCPVGIGLTTALSVLPGGWVVVGSLPAGSSGSLPSVNPAGCLIVLNSAGTPVETWSNQNINGPWDMAEQTTSSGADLFVSNAVSEPVGEQGTPQNGKCSIGRVDVSLQPGKPPSMTSTTGIGSGFACKANKAAFVLAPTGLALGHNGTLYVAETPGNHITAIPDALNRTRPVKDGSSTLISGGALNAPLGMGIAPDGDLIVVNGNDGNAVEVSPQGKQVATRELFKNGAGDLFGLTFAPVGQELFLVDDGTNALEVAHGM